MSMKEYFEGFKKGFDFGARFKYLQINLIELMKEMEKLNNKGEKSYWYELWSQVVDIQCRVEELYYEDDENINRYTVLEELLREFNACRRKYLVLLEECTALMESNANEVKRKKVEERK
jgi:hypothetical protein